MTRESPWTPELDARLIALWATGMPTRAIGAELGVTHNSVISRARRIDMPPRPSPIIRTGPAPEAKPRVRPPAVNSAAAVEHARAVGVQVWRKPHALPVVANPLTLEPFLSDDFERMGIRMVRRDRLPIPVGANRPHKVCQWPLNDAKPWMFCLGESVPHFSYCAEHVRMAFKTVQELRDEPTHEPTPAGRVAMNTRSWA
jgi:GcrA cell cycle regulator